jgi:hypothetical protein
MSNIMGKNDDSLMWNITIVKGGLWLSLTNLDDPQNRTSGGILLGGQLTRMLVAVDTRKCPDPGLYVGEISVNATGTVSQWAVVITFTVRDIIIDASWASSEWPNRVNVNSTQNVAFHAEWAINCSDATGANLTITGNSTYVPANTTGWATFSVSSQSPANTTFRVEKVKFDNITSFWQTAPNRTITWDRVKIVLSMPNNYVDVDSAANISWNSSYYELDKKPFDGFVLFNDSLTRDHVDEASISASQITSYDYPGLTAFVSNSVDVVWDEIRIIQGGVSSSQAASGQTEYVWFIAVYEKENTLFRGENGTLILNVTQQQDNTVNVAQVSMDYSFDDKWMWRKDFNYSTSGPVTFQVAAVNDYVHHLTKIEDGVGPLSIMWGERPWWEALLQTNDMETTHSQTGQQVQPVQTASSAYAVLAAILIATAVIGLILTLLLLMIFGKKTKSAAARKKAAQANQNSARLRRNKRLD